MAKERACNNPSVFDIYDICKYLKFSATIEVIPFASPRLLELITSKSLPQNKAFSKDPYQNGRVKVNMKDELGNPKHAEIQSRNIFIHWRKRLTKQKRIIFSCLALTGKQLLSFAGEHIPLLRSRYKRQITGKVVDFTDDGNCFMTKEEAEVAEKDIAKRIEAAQAARAAQASKGSTKVNPQKNEKKGKGKKKGKKKK